MNDTEKILEALRKVYAKLNEIEKKIDKVTYDKGVEELAKDFGGTVVK